MKPLVIICAASVAIGCGKDATGGLDEEGYVVLEPKAPMTAEEKVAVYQTLSGELASVLPGSDVPLVERDLSAETRQAAEALAALPEVAAVFYWEEAQMASIVLTDGSQVGFTNNRPPGLSEATVPRQGLPDIRSVSDQNRAVMTAFDGGQDVADELAVSVASAGYEILPLGASLADMEEYKDLGFLHLDTHAVAFSLLDLRTDSTGRVTGYAIRKDASGEDLPAVYGVQTSTSAEIRTLGDYADGFNNDDLIVAMSETPSPNGTQYFVKIGITAGFIAKHWSLSEALAILHICYGARDAFVEGGCVGNCPPDVPTLDPSPIRQAILDAGANGLMTFDQLTNSRRARDNLGYFVDRLLGANVEASVVPPNRPFDWRSVEASMIERGLDTFEVNGRTVAIKLEGLEDPVAMAPSIASVDVVDDRDATSMPMTLHGLFGAVMGQVSMGGVPVTVTSWEPTEIVAQVPHGLAGDIQVVAANNTVSNRVPMTQWTGKLVIRFTSDDVLVKTIGVDARFRADVHPRRTSVDATARARLVPAYLSSPHVQGFTTGSGTFTNSFGTQIVWSGGQELLVYGQEEIRKLLQGMRPMEAFGGTSQFAGFVEVDPTMDKATFCLFVEAYHDVFFDGLIQGPDESYFSLNLFGMIAAGTRGLFQCFAADMQEDLSIPDGQWIYSVPGTQLEIEWRDFTVESAFTNSTPG